MKFGLGGNQGGEGEAYGRVGSENSLVDLCKEATSDYGTNLLSTPDSEQEEDNDDADLLDMDQPLPDGGKNKVGDDSAAIASVLQSQEHPHEQETPVENINISTSLHHHDREAPKRSLGTRSKSFSHRTTTTKEASLILKKSFEPSRSVAQAPPRRSLGQRSMSFSYRSNDDPKNKPKRNARSKSFTSGSGTEGSDHKASKQKSTKKTSSKGKRTKSCERRRLSLPLDSSNHQKERSMNHDSLAVPSSDKEQQQPSLRTAPERGLGRKSMSFSHRSSSSSSTRRRSSKSSSSSSSGIAAASAPRSRRLGSKSMSFSHRSSKRRMSKSSKKQETTMSKETRSDDEIQPCIQTKGDKEQQEGPTTSSSLSRSQSAPRSRRDRSQSFSGSKDQTSNKDRTSRRNSAPTVCKEDIAKDTASSGTTTKSSSSVAATAEKRQPQQNTLERTPSTFSESSSSEEEEESNDLQHVVLVHPEEGVDHNTFLQLTLVSAT